MIKAIIFDMDGVLVDSPKYNWKAYDEIFTEDGTKIEVINMKKYLGRSLRDQLILLREDYGIKEYNLEDFSKRAGEIQFKLIEEGIKDKEQLRALLSKLKEDGFKLAVATSSVKWRTDKILDLLGIKDCFEVIISSDNLKRHKPHPDIFLKAAEELSVNPKNCVVVEDALNGVQAAKNGGMKAIALLTEFHTREEFKEADIIIESIFDINKELVKSLE